MIKEVTMYTVICDNCGEDCNASAEFSSWSDGFWAEEMALEIDWIKGEKFDTHYCPDCYYYDEEDNLVIKNNGLTKL
jgi:hypothetical protein